MSNLRRYYQKGATYFITSVTFNRQPILISHFELLYNSLTEILKKSKCDLIAYVVLPDHFHLLFNPNENNFSKIIQRIKMSFTMKYLKEIKQKSGRVWQNRFWDHVIRNEKDLKHHFDYIHFNPYKHGYMINPVNWEYGSIHKYSDFYDDMGINEKIFNGNEYGE